MSDLHSLAARIRLTGDVRADMIAFLDGLGFPKTTEHCLNVAEQAEQLAIQFDVDPPPARVAGWLHDVSAVIPDACRVNAARQWNLEVLDEEAAVPMILHQKLSAAMAERFFQIGDQGVLEAIACHTTLRASASALDKVVFLADKIAWDQAGRPPYLDDVLDALEQQSLDRAVWHYLDALWQRRETLAVVHPSFVDAYRQLTHLVKT
jgi:predicted HD superfamily hydrolase involved in NAD metabolism